MNVLSSIRLTSPLIVPHLRHQLQVSLWFILLLTCRQTDRHRRTCGWTNYKVSTKTWTIQKTFENSCDIYEKNAHLLFLGDNKDGRKYVNVSLLLNQNSVWHQKGVQALKQFLRTYKNKELLRSVPLCSLDTQSTYRSSWPEDSGASLLGFRAPITWSYRANRSATVRSQMVRLWFWGTSTGWLLYWPDGRAQALHTSWTRRRPSPPLF